jgi:aromatic-L-amino-acid decarboxylase
MENKAAAMDTKQGPTERSLDPASEAEWAELRALGHRMLDEMFDHIRGISELPTWRKPPAEMKVEFASAGVPRLGGSAEAVYEEFVRDVLPYGIGNAHPRFWGWVMGGGTPVGMLAEMLAAGMNPNVGGFDDSARMVEDQVLRWLAELMGMPAGTSGLLTSGGSMANLLGLAVGRYARAGFDVREEGMPAGRLPRVYCSTETHSWLKKAVELMGMGRVSLCVVGVDECYRMRFDELADAVAADRAGGYLPLCVVGSAGTVNTGATDDLTAIADLCVAEGMWFHVDGAFGALAYLSERLRPALIGMERADSLAFDLHKWGYMPYDVGCVLVRDAELHRAAFATDASYLTALQRGPVAGGIRFAERTPELSRAFRSLKVWMSLKIFGVDALVEQIEKNVEQSRYLAGLVDTSPVLELAADVPLNLVCFRYRDASDAENQEILMRVQESGIAVPSGTVVGGRFAIRVANTNHRSRREDFDLLVETVERIGREVTAG